VSRVRSPPPLLLLSSGRAHRTGHSFRISLPAHENTPAPPRAASGATGEQSRETRYHPPILGDDQAPRKRRLVSWFGLPYDEGSRREVPLLLRPSGPVLRPFCGSPVAARLRLAPARCVPRRPQPTHNEQADRRAEPIHRESRGPARHGQQPQPQGRTRALPPCRPGSLLRHRRFLVRPDPRAQLHGRQLCPARAGHLHSRQRLRLLVAWLALRLYVLVLGSAGRLLQLGTVHRPGLSLRPSRLAATHCPA
jgi:hypothetical protein